MPYLVPADRLLGLIGSGDRQFLAEIAEQQADRIAELDENFDDHRDEDEEDDSARLGTLEAIGEIIDGKPIHEHLGHVYGYAFERICDHLGELLPNSYAGGRSAWVDRIDAHLGRLGLGLSLTNLIYRGPPTPLPDPDDYPFIGHWTASEVAAAAGAIEGLDLDCPDSEEEGALKEIRGWLEDSRAKPGSMIVGFCY